MFRDGVKQFYDERASGVFTWTANKAWGPNVPANQASPPAYQELGVSALSGDGSTTAPWLLSVTLGIPASDLLIEQRITYVNGDDFIGYEWVIQNIGLQTQTYTLFHAADLYLSGDDYGTGYYNAETSAIGGRNRLQDQYELFIPLTPASAYQEASYSSIWRAISNADVPGLGFDNTTVPTYIDNGAGLEWSDRSLEPGQSESIRDYLSFADIPLNPALSADPDRSMVIAQPAQTLANGDANATIIVTLLDNQGRPVPGKSVQVQSDRLNDLLSQPATLTDFSGRTTATLRSTEVGTATLTVTDSTDDIVLTKQAQVAFVAPVENDFAHFIQEQVTSNKGHLTSVAREHTEVAEVGRYFRGKFGADVASMVVSTLFDSYSLATAWSGFSTSLASKSISHIATPGYKAAVNASWQGYTKGAERHFFKPIYDSFHNGIPLTGAKLDQVMLAAIKYYGPKVALKYGKGLIKKPARAIGEYMMTQTTDPFGDYDQWMNELATAYGDELDAPRDELLAALPSLGLTASEERIYRDDIIARNTANRVLAERIASQISYLKAAQKDREARENSFCWTWCPFLLKHAAVAVATFAWDGPGYFVGNLLGEGALFAWNRWQEAKNLSQDLQIALDSYTFVSGANASLTLQRINQNTMNGLYLVKTRDMPIKPDLTIGTPEHYSAGECRDWLGTKFVEDQSYTQVSVTNNSFEDTTIEAWAAYQDKPGWFSQPVMLYREAPGTTLVPGESTALRFTYRHQGDGETPIDRSGIQIQILGTTSTGTYLVDTLDPIYRDPRRIDASGNPVDCLLKAQARVAAEPAPASPAPTVGFPVNTYIAQVPGTDQFAIQVLVENGLTTALRADIAQPLPPGAMVMDVGGGLLGDNQVSWSTTLGPGQPAIFTVRVRLPATARAVRPTALPTSLVGAQATFVDIDSGQTAVFNAPTRDVPEPIIVDASAYVPEVVAPGSRVTIPVELHNRRSDGDTSATLHVAVLDLSDTVYDQVDTSFTLAAGADQEIGPVLTMPSAPGAYLVVGSLPDMSGSPQVFSEIIQVSVDAPTNRISFVATRDGNTEIYSMNADGSDQRRLTATAAAEGWPGLSTDGNLITFWSDRDGNQEIYVMNADGSNQQRLIFNSAIDEAPAWSPDARSIAFMSKRDGNNEIYVMNADGTNQRRLTFNAADDNAPVWSPDGSSIAFRSRRNGNDEIYVMNADGSNQRRLTNNPADDRAPAWSPDGQSIAFHSRRDGNFEIYVMNADGSNPRRLTNNRADEQTPSWSPDGKFITFMSRRDGNQEIYVMNADGTNQQRLTNNTSDDHSPGWWSR